LFWLLEATAGFVVDEVPVDVDVVVDVYAAEVVDVDRDRNVDPEEGVCAKDGVVEDGVVEIGSVRVAVGVENVGVAIAVGVGDDDDDAAAADVVGRDTSF
jgi:hypothetical protein